MACLGKVRLGSAGLGVARQGIDQQLNTPPYGQMKCMESRDITLAPASA